MSKVIGASLYVPGNRNRKDKARLSILRCSLPEEFSCPLLERGKCAEPGAILSFGCLYGRITRLEGFTRRAGKFYRKVRAFEEKREAYGPMPEIAPKRLAVIGEWVWLPYAHMDMCEQAPFKNHGGAFRLGVPFIKAEDFTAEVVALLARFRPHALMGGVITKYQVEEVPRFLFHLRRDMPDLYAAAVELGPEIPSKIFNVDMVKGGLTSVFSVSPGVPFRIDRGKLIGTFDGIRVTIVQAGDDNNVIGLYSKYVDGDVTISFEPAVGLKVLVSNRDEILRLWDEGLLIVS